MQEIREELNHISKTVTGHYLNFGSIKYDDEINDLIRNPGSQEFIAKSSFKAKAEFLAYADNSNLIDLLKLYKNEEIYDIAHGSTVDQLRAILNKLLINSEAQKIFFNKDLIDNIEHLDEEKSLLIKGYLRRIYFKDDVDKEEFSKNEKLKSKIEFLEGENNSIRETYGKSIDLLKSEYKKQVDELISKIQVLEQKNAEIIQERIDKNLSTYVDKSVGELRKIEGKLKDAAGRWSSLSIIILFLGFSAGIGFALFGYVFGPDLQKLKWPELLIFSIKGIFIVSAFVAAAGYSFMKSNAFTHEAIIVSNRAHAIQFGQLYLDIYGNTVERGEMQKIFENWNISSDTAFLKHKNDKSDPVKFSEFLDSLKKVKELIPGIGKD